MSFQSCFQSRLTIKKTLTALVPVLFILSAPLHAQNRLQSGLKLYGEGRFPEAAAEFRAIEPVGAEYIESLYWRALAEMARGNYRESLSLFETLERSDPANRHAKEIPYHKGRLYYYLGRHEEAIITLSNYSENQTGAARKAAAMYWAGESLYAMGQFDRAETVFLGIVEHSPDSIKSDAARYRLELIKQKKVEAELLSILKWKDEESLKTLEEYRRREIMYDQALAAYQKRLMELEGVPPAAELPDGNAAGAVNKSFLEPGLQDESSPGHDTAALLYSLQNDVFRLKNLITERLDRETW
jgi:tetratricopeptide (TPR) repeat protein